MSPTLGDRAANQLPEALLGFSDDLRQLSCEVFLIAASLGYFIGSSKPVADGACSILTRVSDNLDRLSDRLQELSKSA